MTFQEDIADLQAQLDEIDSIGELRTRLARRDLRLVVSIYTQGVHCMDWDITTKKVCGIVQLAFSIQIRRISSDDALVETTALCPVSFNRVEWFDQKKLFEIFKVGIKECIKKVR
ncbi:hypothetical protein [Candidatus Neptunochlamydia vexilliferae]|uniref:DUF5655 domain-containing protein n=1 Tax=Candidatus Neptunichlamydia vexilliferae TaxID=1651774 RepID=A0ABS0B2I3_9BACT|nr:hypothetical protein [Candidatus Neptunochlamydia vexilliferae]MBF5060082.1 hypothetical protein [Candidatus Neptunochlamydia vexilliferae]